MSLPTAATVRTPHFEHVSLLLSRDLGAMLCPFGGAKGRIDSSTPFNSPACGDTGRLSMTTWKMWVPQADSCKLHNH